MAGLAVGAGRLQHDIALDSAEVAFLAGVFGPRALFPIHDFEVGMVIVEDLGRAILMPEVYCVQYCNASLSFHGPRRARRYP